MDIGNREDLEPGRDLYVGLGGATRNACVALCTTDRILGICEQERLTRVRAAGFNASGLPDEALDELLRRSHRRRSNVAKYALAEPVSVSNRLDAVLLDHHFTHACSAFLPSPFESATIVVCDHDAPQITVWDGKGTAITRVEWPWHGPGFAEVYSQSAAAIGFSNIGGEQQMEALARLDPTRHNDRLDQLFGLESDRLRLAPDWQGQVESGRGASQPERISVAASVQSRVGDLLIEFVAEVMRRRPAVGPLCLGGSLFLNSYFNSRVKQSRVAGDVFIPINPDNAGLAVGAALHLRAGSRQPVTPFLGPRYDHQEIKATLDNCKLNYDWVSQTDIVAMAVEDLQKGRLVGWFDGAMEWGPRSLGGRSILASPFTPHVLDNLNRFLKQRDPWRGYALSGLDAAVHHHFDGPDASPLMECDYMPRDPESFRHVLPAAGAAARVQTVGSSAPPLFRELLDAFGKETGCPIVVNTSFNGFREPMVCSPRDAVRVFFGTGIDTLVIDKFIIRKS